MKKRRILALMHPDLVPPPSRKGFTEQEAHVWKTEFDVITSLRGLGHSVRPLGAFDDVLPIRNAVRAWRPHIVFNLLEEFHGKVHFDQNIVSYLELLGVPYTGNNPRGLVLTRDKGLTKKILSYHGIRIPQFVVYRRRERVGPPGIAYPLIVKSLVEHASYGISRASLVQTDGALASRVKFVHDTIGTDAIAEEYIPGRELYVGVIGNRVLQVLPVWEMLFENLPPQVPPIATEKIKHDVAYQDKWGIYQQSAEGLTDSIEALIARTSKQIYRLLDLEGYARIDFRLRDDGALFFLEANPNPEIARHEEFASAAAHGGLGYPALLQKIVNLGLRRGVLTG